MGSFSKSFKTRRVVQGFIFIPRENSQIVLVVIYQSSTVTFFGDFEAVGTGFFAASSFAWCALLLLLNEG